MIAAEDVVLILLAAGRSQRFGIPNKLEVPFLNKPVGLHVVTAFEAVRGRMRFEDEPASFEAALRECKE